MGETFVLFVILLNIGGVIGALAIIIAIWRGMKAQERMAASLETIEAIIRRNQARE